jgi:hypothetical protein
MNALQEQTLEPRIDLRSTPDSRLDTLISEQMDSSEINRVSRTLSSILSSAQFRSSKQCQDLLRYVIEQSLNDQSDLLRERVIGATVFGRRPDYDTANDPIVRARMAEVRKRLAQYYHSDSFDSWQAVIQIPPGHYRATFRLTSPPEAAPADEQTVPEPVKAETVVLPAAVPASRNPVIAQVAPAARSAKRTWLFFAGAVLLLLAIIAGGLKFFSVPKTTAFDQFWSPVLVNPTPVIIYTGTNVVYRFSPQFLEEYRKSHHMENNGPEFAVNLKDLDLAGARSLQVSSNAYVTSGDVSAATAITSAMVRLKKPYELRFAQDISPGDLHSAPIVLLGAFNNPWTLNTTSGLRFSFSGGDTIKDALDSKRSWHVNVKQDGHTTDDYAIMTRLLNGDRDQTRMTAAGIGQYGTQAAAEFLSSPERINAFSRTAPAGWNNKNLQIVIHVRVVDEVPASTEIVATYLW